MKWNTVEIALVRLLFNWNFSPHYGQQVVPLSFGKRINDAWMKNFSYDYCYYSVGVVVAAKKSWFHLGLPQGSWLAYYCPPWLSTLSCFLPLLLLLLPRKGKLKKGKREAIEVLEAAKVNVVSVKEFAAKSHVSGRQIWINFDLDFMLILERNAVI